MLIIRAILPRHGSHALMLLSFNFRLIKPPGYHSLHRLKIKKKTE
jgi:hypothetical protein